MTLHVCKHSNQLRSVILVIFFTIFSTMTSLCRHLSVVSTGNCKLSQDCRRVCSHQRHDETRQFHRVGGVYWTLEITHSRERVEPQTRRHDGRPPEPIGNSLGSTPRQTCCHKTCAHYSKPWQTCCLYLQPLKQYQNGECNKN